MEIKEKKKERRIMLIIVGTIVAVMGIYKGVQEFDDRGWVFILFGLLILCISFYTSETVINREGVNKTSSVFGIKKSSMWKWEEIKHLDADFKTKVAPDAMLEIFKGKLSRRIQLEERYVQQVFSWAADNNSSLTIKYNGSHMFKVKGRTAKRISKENDKKTFREYADEARKIRAKYDAQDMTKKK